MKDFNPFFINSNFIIENKDIKDFNSFMLSCANNVGNSYITYSLVKSCCKDFHNIQHIQNIYDIKDLNIDYYVDIINNQCSHVFVVLTDILRKYYNDRLDLGYRRIEEIINKINKPVIVCGIGANAFGHDRYNLDFYKDFNKGLVRLMSAISDHSVSIGVRGYKTQEILHKLGIKNVDVVGCPSYFENGKNRPPINKQKLNRIEDIITTFGQNYSIVKNATSILQDNTDVRFIDAVAFNNFNYKYSINDLKSLNQRKIRIFSDVYSWKKCIKEHKFYLGYRLHGSIVALNSGIPAICLNSDFRAREMCEYLAIPHKPGYSWDYSPFELYESLDMEQNNATYAKLYDKKWYYFVKLSK